MALDQCVEFFLAIRSEVVVAASPERVWSCLDRPQDWKPSIVAVEHVRGTPGNEGELVRVAQRPATEVTQVLMETVRLDPPSWRVQTLVTEASRATDGYLIYYLRPYGTSTELACEVLGRCALPLQNLAGSAVREFAQRINEDTRRKLDADLRLLKALAEGSP